MEIPSFDIQYHDHQDFASCFVCIKVVREREKRQFMPSLAPSFHLFSCLSSCLCPTLTLLVTYFEVNSLVHSRFCWSFSFDFIAQNFTCLSLSLSFLSRVAHESLSPFSFWVIHHFDLLTVCPFFCWHFVWPRDVYSEKGLRVSWWSFLAIIPSHVDRRENENECIHHPSLPALYPVSFDFSSLTFFHLMSTQFIPFVATKTCQRFVCSSVAQ